MLAISWAAIVMRMLMNKVDCVTVAEQKQYLLDADSLVASPNPDSSPPIPPNPFHLTCRLVLIFETKLSSIRTPRHLCS